jgi:type IV pilus assembly protein PilA
MRVVASNACRSGKGFSLVELMVVLTILLVLAAIAAANFSRSREAASEAAAVSSMRTIAVSEIGYHSTYGGYAPTLDALGPPKPGMSADASRADLIDGALASGYRNGYRFSYASTDQNGDGLLDRYEVNADPERRPASRPHFYMDESGIIRVEMGQRAGPRSKPASAGLPSQP